VELGFGQLAVTVRVETLEQIGVTGCTSAGSSSAVHRAGAGAVAVPAMHEHAVGAEPVSARRRGQLGGADLAAAVAVDLLEARLHAVPGFGDGNGELGSAGTGERAGGHGQGQGAG